MQKNSYYMMPTSVSGDGSPAVWNYDILKLVAGNLTGYVKIKVDVLVALALAEKSPYPRGVKLGVMKQVANSKEITLSQMQILLGWAARRAQKAR